MRPELRLLAKTIDPAVIGARIREARVRAGLTQGELADAIASTAYVSRLESGSRRAHPDILARMAERLDVPLDVLLADEREAEQEAAELAGEVAELRLRLDYAELALRTGSALEALAGAEAVATTPATPPDLRTQAAYVHALAQEATGQVNAAIIELEDLAADETVEGLTWVRVLMALSRCYRVSGDLASASDVGERGARRIEALGLSRSAEAVQLTVTVAAAFFERGDANHAVRMCLRALDVAETLDSPAARASVYWNSSLFEAEQGRMATALPLAEKAIALLEVTEDARNIARLRGEIGFMQLRLDPPQPLEAISGLTRTMEDLAWTSASPADMAHYRLGLAQALFLLGDDDEVGSILDEILATTRTTSPMTYAGALVLRGQVAAREGRSDDVLASFRAAVLVAAELGFDRGAAQIWFELATLLKAHGHVEEAMDAYHRAATSTGLSTPMSYVVRRTAGAGHGA